jgi:GDP-L-fucose synthase
MLKHSKIYVAGHNGLVGSAILRSLNDRGFSNIIVRTRGDLDLTRQKEVEDFFRSEKPEYVFLAAAKVGGIWANSTQPADFACVNMLIQTNLINATYQNDVKRLIFLGSSCIYPKLSPQPMKEEYLLSGSLEPSNEAYAVAKIAGVVLCESYNRQYGAQYLAVMPTNLYGTNDNFDLETSHVLPALIRKFHLARLVSKGDWQGIERDQSIHGHIPGELLAAMRPSDGSRDEYKSRVTLWGSGTPRREFLHVDDLANACLFLMGLDDHRYSSLINGEKRPTINIGCGEDLTIRDLAELIAGIIGYRGKIVWDCTKPDGVRQKLLDVSKMRELGWKPSISLENGIKATYEAYCRYSV